jgi:DNA-binding PadR family transcriptional regulator
MLRRMEERGFIPSEWEKKVTGADRRVFTLTVTGVNFLKEGPEMVKSRRKLILFGSTTSPF